MVPIMAIMGITEIMEITVPATETTDLIMETMVPATETTDLIMETMVPITETMERLQQQPKLQ